jgi:hypothetical protein
MAQVYRYSKGIGNIDAERLFERAAMTEGPVTRQSGDGENFRIPSVFLARLDIRKNFCSTHGATLE